MVCHQCSVHTHSHQRSELVHSTYRKLCNLVVTSLFLFLAANPEIVARVVGEERTEDVADGVAVEILRKRFSHNRNGGGESYGTEEISLLVRARRWLRLLDVLDVHERTEATYDLEARLLGRLLKFRNSVFMNMVGGVALAVVARRAHQHRPTGTKRSEARAQHRCAVLNLHVFDHLVMDDDVEARADRLPVWERRLQELFVFLHKIELAVERESLRRRRLEFVEVHANVRVDVRSCATGKDLTEWAVFATTNLKHVVLRGDEAASEAPPPEVR